MDKLTPTILVIMGITGDLTAKKVAPALFNLYRKKVLSEKFRIVGFGRREFTDVTIREYVQGLVLAKFPDADQKDLAEFLALFEYQQGLFETGESYENLKQKLHQIQEGWGEKTNRLFYLAVPPDIYGGIFENLKSSGLIDHPDMEAQTRILVEKPFGKDGETAEKLDMQLGSLFAENKIYRIDQYLAKEMLENILAFRFYNDSFEKIWNKDFIEKIEIRLWESLGVEKRGAFYDGVGALRDVGQNHLLQMLALVTMDYPLDFSPAALHLKRAQTLLEVLKPMSEKEIKTQTYRAQHEGYTEIDGVKPNSTTETYFKVVTVLAGPRWAGVPVIFDGGKRMPGMRKELIVTMRHPENCFCPPGHHYKNRIIFSIEPIESIVVELWAKKPGYDQVLEKRTMDFILRNSSERIQYVEEYEKLFLDAILGDQTLFVSTREVKAMWDFIDPIVEAWQKNAVPLKKYQPDTDQAPQDSLELDN